MSSVGFEPTISAGERPKTYALDSTATETGAIYQYRVLKNWLKNAELERNCKEFVST
jgi:hypothetical protein